MSQPAPELPLSAPYTVRLYYLYAPDDHQFDSLEEALDFAIGASHYEEGWPEKLLDKNGRELLACTEIGHAKRWDELYERTFGKPHRLNVWEET